MRFSRLAASGREGIVCPRSRIAAGESRRGPISATGRRRRNSLGIAQAKGP